MDFFQFELQKSILMERSLQVHKRHMRRLATVKLLGLHPPWWSNKQLRLTHSVVCMQGEVGILLPAAAVHHGQNAEAAEQPGGTGSSSADHLSQNHGQSAVEPACC